MELGLLCTDEDDIGEFNEMYGPVLARCERDHGGFKKVMWCGIRKEFNCKVTSTWSTCGREREREKEREGKERPFTHQQFGKQRERRAHCRAKVEVGQGSHLQRCQNMEILGTTKQFVL